MPIVHSLAYQPERSEYKEPYRFNRVAMDTINLIEGHGIEGDFKAGRNPKRQLNIMSLSMVHYLETLGYTNAPGELGEQLVVDGLDVDSLERGTLLQIGDEAIIEITMTRTGCTWLGLIHDRENAAEETENKLGKLAKVVRSGRIHVGNMVKVLEHIADAAPEGLD